MDDTFIYNSWREHPNCWWTTTSYAWPIIKIKNIQLVKRMVTVVDPFDESVVLSIDELKARISPRISVSVRKEKADD